MRTFFPTSDALRAPCETVVDGIVTASVVSAQPMVLAR